MFRVTDRATAVAAWEALLRAQVAVMRRLGTDFSGLEVSFNEYDAIYILMRSPDRSLRLRDLNRNVLLAQPSVSRLVDRLAARGLVEKLPDPTDARGTVIALTDAGLEVFRRVTRIHAASIERLVGQALSDDEAAAIIKLCTELRDRLPPEE